MHKSTVTIDGVKLRQMIHEAILKELNISPALFSGGAKTISDPMDNKNVVKSITDLERSFTVALTNNILLSHPEAYDKETREFNDELYNKIQSAVEESASELVARVSTMVRDAWKKTQADADLD